MREIVTVRNGGFTTTFPHVTLLKLKEGPAQNYTFHVCPASSTQVHHRLIAKPQRDTKLPETRALSLTPSCHSLVPEITVSCPLCRVALISMQSPKALHWIMDVTEQRKKCKKYKLQNEKSISRNYSYVEKHFIRVTTLQSISDNNVFNTFMHIGHYVVQH